MLYVVSSSRKVTISIQPSLINFVHNPEEQHNPKSSHVSNNRHIVWQAKPIASDLNSLYPDRSHRRCTDQSPKCLDHDEDSESTTFIHLVQDTKLRRSNDGVHENWKDRTESIGTEGYLDVS